MIAIMPTKFIIDGPFHLQFLAQHLSLETDSWIMLMRIEMIRITAPGDWFLVSSAVAQEIII